MARLNPERRLRALLRIPGRSGAEPLASGTRQTPGRARSASPVLLVLVVALTLLATLPARRATAAFPPGFSRFVGSVLVADNLAPNPNGGFGAVLRIAPTTGSVIQRLSDPGGAVMTTNRLSDVRVNPANGNIYVATDPPGGATQTIVVFDALGNHLRNLTVPGGTAGLSGDGYGIDSVGDGTVWTVQRVGASGGPQLVQVADISGAPVIQRIDLAATSTPFDVAVGTNGRLYVTDQTNAVIGGGAVVQVDAATGAITANFNAPTPLGAPTGIEFIDISGAGAVRVADPGPPGPPWVVNTFGVPGSSFGSMVTTLGSGAPPFIPANGEPDFTATRFAADGDREGDFWTNRDDFHDGSGLGTQSAIQLYDDADGVLNQVSNTAGVGTPFVQPEGVDLAVAPPQCLVVTFDPTFTAAAGEEVCHPLTAINTCAFPLRITGLGGLPLGSPFHVDPGVRLPYTLNPGQSVTFEVCFAPPKGATAGPVGPQTLTLTSSDPFGTTQTFALTATVLATPPPDITAAPAALDFGTVAPFGSNQRVLHLANTATDPESVLTITAITSSSPAAVVQAPSLPLVIGGGASLPVTVTFTPTVSGPFSGSITVVSDDPDESPLIVPVSAGVDAASPGDLGAPGFLEFPATVVGRSTERTVTLSNSGDVVMRVNLSLAPGVQYELVNGPASGFVLIGSGSTETLTVRFTPAAPGREIKGTLALSVVDPLAPGMVFGTASVDLCGEGELPGARVLVTTGGVPAVTVKRIILQRWVGSRWVNVVDKRNVPLKEYLRAPCSPVRFHMHRGLNKVGRYRFMVTQGNTTKTPEFFFTERKFVEVVAAF